MLYWFNQGRLPLIKSWLAGLSVYQCYLAILAIMIFIYELSMCACVAHYIYWFWTNEWACYIHLQKL